MKTLRSRLLGRVLILGAFLALPARLLAQEAVMSGTVTDTTGGVLPGVTITAVNDATGNNFLAVTDNRGGFRLHRRTGWMRVTAELPGFNAPSRHVDLLLGQTVVLNLQMAPPT